MSLDYGKAADTKPSTSRNPFLEGDVDFKLLVTKSEEISGHKGHNYIVEVQVLEAKAFGKNEAPPVGARRVVIIDLDNKDFGLANLMAYAYGLNGGPMEGADQAARGMKLRKLLGSPPSETAGRVQAFAEGCVIGNRTTAGFVGDKKEKPFTFHNWYTLKQTKEQVEARRAAIKTGEAVTLAADNTAA